LDIVLISISPDLRTRFPGEGVGFMSGLVIVFVSETFCSVGEDEEVTPIPPFKNKLFIAPCFEKCP